MNIIQKQIFFAVVFWVSTIQLSGQDNSVNSSPQYLYPEFTNSIVKMKNGEIQNAVVNYNMVSEMMVFEKDDKLFSLMNIELIDTILLQNSKFVPVGKAFYELLISGHISLLIQNKGVLKSKPNLGGYGTTSEISSTTNLSGINTGTDYVSFELPDDVMVKARPVYWIMKDNEMYRIQLKNDFLKLFPDHEDNINKFIKKNRTKMFERNDLIKLVNYVNELIK